MELDADNKNQLFRTVRDIERARDVLGVSDKAVKYLEIAVSAVARGDCENGRTPHWYGRVDDMAYDLRVTPRTVNSIERRLADLGLIERNALANGHRRARRDRATGELRDAHGISLGPLIDRRDELAELAIRATEQDERFRHARNRVSQARARLMDAVQQARRRPALRDLEQQAQATLDASPDRIVRGTHSTDALERIEGMFWAMIDAIAESILQTNKAVDNALIDVDISDGPEIQVRHKYDTNPHTLYSCSMKRTPPKNGGDIISRKMHPNGRSCWGKKDADGGADHNPQNQLDMENIPIKELWKIAPASWRNLLGDDVPPSWDVLPEVAEVIVPKLGIGHHLWIKARRDIGPAAAAAAVLTLDCNRQHPTHPVKSVGASLNGMLRNAADGKLNLAASLFGILSRHTDRGIRDGMTC